MKYPEQRKSHVRVTEKAAVWPRVRRTIDNCIGIADSELVIIV